MDWLKKNTLEVVILVIGTIVITTFVLIQIFTQNILSNVLGKEVYLPEIYGTPIYKVDRYALDCKTTYYTAILTGGVIINEPHISINKGNEQQVLYIERNTAKFFGADYTVIQDDEDYLIIIRTYPVSGLTETVTINKKNGVGFDTKTMAIGVSGGPQSDTYILKCSEL